MSHSVLAFGLMTILAGVVSGDEKVPEKDGPVESVLIVLQSRVIPKEGVGKCEAIRIRDPKKIATVERFFPGYRTRPQSNRGGAWELGYSVYFAKKDGSAIEIKLSDDGKVWSVSQGDFVTKGDFKTFVESLP